MKMNSLYSWQGGKFYEKRIIIPLMPIHEWYVEVFGGSFVLLLNKPKAEKEFGNDKFSCLINFWNCVNDSRMARKLIKKIELTLDSRFNFQEYMKQEPEELSRIDRAYRFLYLTSFGFNSYHDTYYSPITHNQYKLKDWINKFKGVGRMLWGVHERVKDVIFTNYDFRDCLKNVKPHKKRFLFLDPPYINTHQYNRGYKADLTFPPEWYEDMRDLLAIHSKGGTMWMITCNQENTYFDEMDDIIIRLIERRTTMNKVKERRPVRTKIVMNYDVNEVGSCLEMLEKKNIGGFMMV